jgi:FKBP12-rapamycin complex-associated protein
LQLPADLGALVAWPPNSLHNVSFIAEWGRKIRRAEAFVRQFIRTRDCLFLHSALGMLPVDNKNSPKSLELAHASPFLANLHDSPIGIPGQSATVASIIPEVAIIPSIMRPRKIVFVGSDGSRYGFLLKADKEVRLDERVVQFFSLVSNIAREVPRGRAMQLMTYPIVALNCECGLMGWLSRCDAIFSLVLDLWRRLDRIRSDGDSKVDPDFRAYLKEYPGSNHPANEAEWEQVYRAFEAAEAVSYCDEVETILIMSAADSRDWLIRKKNYTASLAATSIAGYVIGLGDRHPNNIMFSLPTGMLVHVDFTDVLERLQYRNIWPEQVPCRLTPALLRPLDVLGAEGELKRLCIVLLEALQNRADEIVQLLAVFVEDPISTDIGYWRKAVEIVKRKLNGIDLRLSGDAWNPEDCSGMGVEMHVGEIIRAATNRDGLKQMWRGWRPWW